MNDNMLKLKQILKLKHIDEKRCAMFVYVGLKYYFCRDFII